MNGIHECDFRTGKCPICGADKPRHIILDVEEELKKINAKLDKMPTASRDSGWELAIFMVVLAIYIRGC